MSNQNLNNQGTSSTLNTVPETQVQSAPTGTIRSALQALEGQTQMFGSGARFMVSSAEVVEQELLAVRAASVGIALSGLSNKQALAVLRMAAGPHNLVVTPGVSVQVLRQGPGSQTEAPKEQKSNDVGKGGQRAKGRKNKPKVGSSADNPKLTVSAEFQDLKRRIADLSASIRERGAGGTRLPEDDKEVAERTRLHAELDQLRARILATPK